MSRHSWGVRVEHDGSLERSYVSCGFELPFLFFADTAMQYNTCLSSLQGKQHLASYVIAVPMCARKTSPMRQTMV
jgi:hypothetical protein